MDPEALRHLNLRVARIALPSPETLSLRNMRVLEGKGLATIPEDTESIPDLLDIGPGPYLVLKESQGTLATMEVTETLLLRNSAWRRLALNTLQDLLKERDGLSARASKSVQNLIRRELDDASSEAEDLELSILVADQLEQDWLYNLRGIVLSLQLGWEEGVWKYASRCLFPRSDMLEDIELEWRIASGAIAEEYDVTSKCQSLDDFESVLGYLPLAPPFTPFDFLLKKGMAEDRAWSSIQSWANEGDSLLRRYHCLKTFATKPALVDPVTNGKLRQDLLADLRSLLFGSGADSTHWATRGLIAKHFSFHLDAEFPYSPGDQTTQLAWWLTDKLCRVLETSPVRPFLVQGLERIVAQTDYTTRPIRLGRDGPSPLRLCTLTSDSIWRVALFYVTAPELITECLADPESYRLVDSTKAELLNFSSDVPQYFGFSTADHKAVRHLVEISGDEELGQLLDLAERLSNISAETLLHQFPDEQEHLRLAFITRLRAIICCRPQDSRQGIIDQLLTPDTRKALFKDTNLVELTALVEALTQLGNAGTSDGQFFSLSHALADAYEGCDEVERKAHLLSLIIATAVSLNQPSAVRRLFSRLDDSCWPTLEVWIVRLKLLALQIGDIAHSKVQPVLAALFEFAAQQKPRSNPLFRCNVHLEGDKFCSNEALPGSVLCEIHTETGG